MAASSSIFIYALFVTCGIICVDLVFDSPILLGDTRWVLFFFLFFFFCFFQPWGLCSSKVVLQGPRQRTVFFFARSPDSLFVLLAHFFSLGIVVPLLMAVFLLVPVFRVIFTRSSIGDKIQLLVVIIFGCIFLLKTVPAEMEILKDDLSDEATISLIKLIGLSHVALLVVCIGSIFYNIRRKWKKIAFSSNSFYWAISNFSPNPRSDSNLS